MAWHGIGDKPLSESMLTQFTDTLAGDELNHRQLEDVAVMLKVWFSNSFYELLS